MGLHPYTAFGLHVDSEIRLPELPVRATGPADVTVRRGAAAAPPPAQAERARSTERGVEVFIETLGRFVIQAGRRLTVHPVAGATDRELRIGILGAGLGVILQQRGVLALHASAVRIEGGVAAFLGAKGMGKSTTAAALYHRGHPLFTDDVLAVRPAGNGEGLVAIPGYPYLKLWPDAVEAALKTAPSNYERVHPQGAKRLSTVRGDRQETPAPLKSIYVLDFDETQSEPVTSAPLAAQEAFRQLVAHSYAKTAFINERQASTHHLQSCSQIVSQLPVRRLVRKRSLEHLPALAARVEAHAAASASGIDAGPASCVEQSAVEQSA